MLAEVCHSVHHSAEMGTLSASYFEKGKAYLLLNEEEDNEDGRNKRQGNKLSEMFPAVD